MEKNAAFVAATAAASTPSARAAAGALRRVSIERYCPFNGSCKACGRSFTAGRKTAQQHARFADDVVAEAVRLYVQSLSSYRVLSVLLERRLGVGVGRNTLSRWVDRVGERAKTPLEVSAELRPACGGILGVDGKVVWAGGKRWALLVGVDHPTQDLVHAVLVPWETPEAFVKLVSEAVRGAPPTPFGASSPTCG